MAALPAQRNIIREIQRLHARRAPLNISAVKRSHPQLIERVYAVRPFWGWKRALEDAGLDYKNIHIELLDYVDCKICGRDFGSLFFHLSARHNIQPRDYARVYPGAELFCETTRAKFSHSHSGRFKRGSALPHWEPIWTAEYVLDRMAEAHRRNFPLNYDWMERHEKALTGHAIRHFGSWDEALRRIDLEPGRIRLAKPIEKPTPPGVALLLKRRCRARKRQVRLRNRADVIEALRQRFLSGKSLSSYAIVTENKLLYHAAQKHIGDFEEVYRMFGVWKPRESRWARANKAAIMAELRRRKAASKTLHSGKIRFDLESGHAFLNRAVTLFGSWTGAIAAAGIDLPRGLKRSSLANAGIHVPAWEQTNKSAIRAEIRRRKGAGES